MSKRPAFWKCFVFLLSHPWTVWIGHRYLRSKKNTRFLSLISALSVLGVIVGVTALIVVLSVMDGFEGQMKRKLMETDLHLLVTPREEIAQEDQGRFSPKVFASSTLGKRIQSSSAVEKVWFTLQTDVMLKNGRREIKGIQLKGVEAERWEELRRSLVESADPQFLSERVDGEWVKLPGIFLGKELAYEMRISAGDRITLISPTEMEGPLQTIPRLKRFVVQGIYTLGTPEQELSVGFAEISAVRSFLRRADAVSQVEIRLKQFDSAPELSRQWSQSEDSFWVRDWQQLNAHLFSSLKLERQAMFIILVFIVVVASFNIITTLTMMVLEKSREISILKAMGAQDEHVGAIFLGEGLMIGSVGVGIGLVLGALICVVFRRYPLLQLPDVYYDRTIPVTFDGFYYFGVGTAAMLIVLLACSYPARRAAIQPILKGILRT